MNKRNPDKNGIQKTTPAFLWISALFLPKILIGLGRSLAAIFTKFFFLQFQTVLFPKTRPVVNVDHPLDEKIPFDTSWVGLYNTFTVFWMQAAGWILKEFGIRAVPGVAQFVNDIARMYNAAGKVYGRCQSTTNRPGVSANFHFIVIHTFDPHLHCVPSLHVMVCAYVGYKVTELINIYAEDPSDYRAEAEWAYKNGLEIIESVLLVKQHSVNCIPAGYYMNSILFNDFKSDWADRFIDEMFVDDAKGISDVSEIQTHIRKFYDKFLDDYDKMGDRDKVLLEFLMNYKNSHGVEVV